MYSALYCETIQDGELSVCKSKTLKKLLDVCELQ